MLVLLFSQQMLSAQEIVIANWYNDKSGAVVMSFDDWLEGHEKIVVPELIKRNLPATFFVSIQNAKWRRTSYEVMREAQAHGCEIANHTMTHPSLPTLSHAAAKIEIDDARQTIIDSVPSAQCLTFAYPMGTKNPEIIAMVQRQHIGARSVALIDERNITYDFASDSSDYFKIGTVRVWHIVSLEKVVQWLDYTAKGGGLLTFMLHSVYNENIEKGWDAMPQEYICAMMDTLKSRQDILWVCTFAAAMKYHQEKKQTEIKLIKEKKGVRTFALQSPLDATIYNQELTLKMAKTANTTKIKQGFRNVDFQYSADGKWILFNVLPGSGNFTIDSN